MQYAFVNGEKVEAQPNLSGLCICCNEPTYSACGKLISWHWRHKNSAKCDNWWETETIWHREWKSQFPIPWREVVQYDSTTDEKHIADIKTHNGIILEFQNSPISLDEFRSREKFYKKMIWIVNGFKFRANFTLGHKLPNPTSDLVKNYKFINSKYLLAYNKLKYSEKDENDLVELLNEINNDNIKVAVEKTLKFYSHINLVKSKRSNCLSSISVFP